MTGCTFPSLTENAIKSSQLLRQHLHFLVFNFPLEFEFEHLVVSPMHFLEFRSHFCFFLFQFLLQLVHLLQQSLLHFLGFEGGRLDNAQFVLLQDFVVFLQVPVRLLDLLQLVLQSAFVEAPGFLFAGLVLERLAGLIFFRFQLSQSRLEVLDGLSGLEEVLFECGEFGLEVVAFLLVSGGEVFEVLGVAVLLLLEERVAFADLGF